MLSRVRGRILRSMKRLGTSRVVWSLLWALAIIASALIFKGTSYVEWIEAGLTGLAVTFVVLAPKPVPCAQ